MRWLAFKCFSINLDLIYFGDPTEKDEAKLFEDDDIIYYLLKIDTIFNILIAN